MTNPLDLSVDGVRLMQGDCLERMAEIPDGSVDFILTDPPYGTVKGLKMYDKYKGGAAAEWDETIEHGPMVAGCQRVLRPNGVKALFCQEPYTSKLATQAAPGVPFSYRLTWKKEHFANALNAKKAPVSYTEDVCVFAKRHVKHDFAGDHPLRPYAAQVCEFIGANSAGGVKSLFAKMGHERACHFTRHRTSQFSLCTAATYAEMDSLFSLPAMPGYRQYLGLKAEDREYREGLIRRMAAEAPKVFNLPAGEKYTSNLLEFRRDLTGHHPTQKPVALMEYLIKTYTNGGDTVLDFTMGSGTTGVACVKTGRKFIGIERDFKYYGAACGRVLGALTL